jgi:hypothetical protein
MVIVFGYYDKDEIERILSDNLKNFPIERIVVITPYLFVLEGLKKEGVQVFYFYGDFGIFYTAIILSMQSERIERKVFNDSVIVVAEDDLKFVSIIYTSTYNWQKENGVFSDILWAKDYETGQAFIESFQESVIAQITDVRFEKDGREDDRAGFKLLDYLNEKHSIENRAIKKESRF